jgi:iduronate 2-sulfatase
MAPLDTAVRCALLAAALLASSGALATAAPNLLFIVVDDLRAQLGGPFGQTTITPSADALAARGIAFTRAYVQISLCSPSRTSFLTGRRPDASRLWTIGPYFRNTNVAALDVVTLPQALKAAGYTATGVGKIWHPGTSSGGDPSWGGGGVGGDDMPWSFSSDPDPAGVDPRLLYWECDAWMNSTGQSAASAGIPGGQGCITSPECVACLEAANATGPPYRAVVTSPCPDACYVDAMIAERAATDLAALSVAARAGTPFAYFVGLKRPHLGWQLPFWALNVYSADQPLAAHREPPPGFPSAGWWENGEVTGLKDVKPYVESGNRTFPGMLHDGYHAAMRRAYYASVTWMDTQLGKVLAALDAEGLAESTVVTFIGDHGWSLGEHGNWAKQQLFENALRIPLIIAPPRGAPGWRTNATVGAEAFVSAVDLFPTVLDLLGVPASSVPSGQLDGMSLAPLLRSTGGSGGAASASFSQIVRADRVCMGPHQAMTLAPPAGDSDPPAARVAEHAPPCAMGLSVRTRGWRYTVWVGYTYEGPLVGPVWSDVRGEELYDHSFDDAGAVPDAGLDYDLSELVSVAADPANARVKAELLAQLQAAFPPTA